MNSLQNRFVQFARGGFQSTAPMMCNSFLEPTIKKLVICASSVGARFYEARSASSDPDFNIKIHSAIIDLQESHFWLQILIDRNPKEAILISLERENKALLDILYKLAKEPMIA